MIVVVDRTENTDLKVLNFAPKTLAGKEDKMKTTDDDASKGPCLIPAADRDVGEELVDEQVLGQLEEVGLVVAPLQDVLLLEGVAEQVKFVCMTQPNQEIIKQVVGSTKVMDFLTPTPPSVRSVRTSYNRDLLNIKSKIRG